MKDVKVVLGGVLALIGVMVAVVALLALATHLGVLDWIWGGLGG